MTGTAARRKGRAVVAVAFVVSLLAALAPAAGLAADDERALHIVVQSAPALALYQGGIAGLAPTNPEAMGEVRLDPDSPASRAYLDHLGDERSALLGRLSELLGRQLKVVRGYDFALNGFATRLTTAEAGLVEAQPGVAFVQRDEVLHTLTDSGPAWMDADEVWDGGAVAGPPSMGERVVAGIIDTGVNTDHPSFAGIGPVDGYAHQNPRGRFYGECAVTPPPLPESKCNNKLIGLYDFTSSAAGAEDDVGHGSHVASTVAGNIVDATLYAPTVTLDATRISGVAPHANIISYKACRSTAFTTPVINLGACPIHALLAAIDQATADVVDVVNFSIGGGSVNPWQDPLGVAFFGSRAAGVFVATSAGNSGPNPQTMGRPANSPWIMAVGASTHDRRPTGRLLASDGSGASVEFVGMTVSDGIGPLALVDAREVGNDLCNPFAPAQAEQIAGKIVVCTQGAIGRVQKGQNVSDAGGSAMVLISQPGAQASVVADTHVVPAVMISENDGTALREWLAGAANAQATIEGTTFENDPALGDRMAYFSSRGPDLNLDGVIKPDVTAPGVAILAAYNSHAGPADEPEYNVIQGTSMSSPHAAGAAALVRSLHRGWGPDQVKSALMSTAFRVPDGGKESVAVTKEDHASRADAFDMGAGRIDVSAAARAGFTLNESVASYHAANPALNGSAETLNLASLANSDCATSCSWTRTIVSTADRSITYDVSVAAGPGFSIEVSPSTFTLDPLQGPTVVPGLPDPSLPGVQTITITATNTGLKPLAWEFGEIRFTPRAQGLPAQHFPVAVKVGGAAPTPDCHIPETIVSSAASNAAVPAYSDVLEVGVAGLFPTLSGEPLPNLTFRMRVRELELNGALPPETFWRVIFVPPGAPSGTRYFVQAWTDVFGTPQFNYGTITSGFSVAGSVEGGSFDLESNDLTWTIAATKITDPQVGDQLTGITGSSGPSQPGTLTLGVKTTPAGSYTLTTCGDGPTPTPTPTLTPEPDLQVTAMEGSSQKPKEGERVVIRATVTNSGDAQAAASQTEFSLSDGSLLGTAETAAIPAGDSVQVEVGWDTRGVKGEQTVDARADAGEQVAESDEGNNVGRLTVTVRGNKVSNGSFEQPNEAGDGPQDWQSESTDAGETSWSDGGSDGQLSVTISGTGGSVALHGTPSWTSAPISVNPGEQLTLSLDVKADGLSSAPSVGVSYLGPAGELLETVSVLSVPLASEGFASLSVTFSVPDGVSELRVVLHGFAPTDLATGGTVTFDNIGLFGE